MNIKTIINTSVALLGFHLSGISLAGSGDWSSDLAAAKKEATESNKDLLIDFSSSDWCDMCSSSIKHIHEVPSHAPLKEIAKDSFILITFNYPSGKSKLSAETIKQNAELKKKYALKGSESILLTDSEGMPYASTACQKGDAEAWVKHLDGLRAAKTKRDEYFSAAAKLDGAEKAKTLIAALDAMGLENEMVLEFYGDIVKQVKAADPMDNTGFAKKEAAGVRLKKRQSELSVCTGKKDYDGALVVVDKALKEGGFSKEETQQIMMSRVTILAIKNKFDEAIKAADEIKAIDPESAMAAQVDDIKSKLEAGKKAVEAEK